MDDVTHLSTNESLSKNITYQSPRVEDERNNVSDNKLCSLSLLVLLNVDVPFIPASDYPTVGEAIRPFEYSRWGLVYVVLINAQQG